MDASTDYEPERFISLTSKVVNRRKGAVLSRGYILKTDHYTSGRALDLDFHLQGAPNFRSAGLKVYGTAQPKLNGVRTILSVLSCFDRAPKPQHATWISTREEVMIYIGGRPFVLRDSDKPFESITLTDRASHLEEIEERLKGDIAAESDTHHGVVLVHEELADGRIVANWLAADKVRTVKELFESLQSEGYRVKYHRLPIAAEQDPESNYLDSYLHLIEDLPTDDCLVFNCGMGVTRTTYAMTAALLVRRSRSMSIGADDPFITDDDRRRTALAETNASALKTFDEARKSQAASKCTLQLMDILNRNAAASRETSGMIETLAKQPVLLQDLRNAVLGRFDVILQLVACLECGPSSKRLVDFVIDHCSDVVNLRHAILEMRLHASRPNMTESAAASDRQRAQKSLERYFFLIAFAAYIDENKDGPDQKFYQWIRSRDEISGMVKRLRAARTWRVLSPVDDLSLLLYDKPQQSSARNGHLRFNSIAGTELVEAQVANLVVSRRQGVALRTGTILKRDIWRRETPLHVSDIAGARNFRHIPDSNVYALAQPTEEGIRGVLNHLRTDVIWINLRRGLSFPSQVYLAYLLKPLLYINSKPYVLRQSSTALRNIQDFAGISSSRLEQLEDRLRNDVESELQSFDGRLLLHQEDDDASVVTVWEPASHQHIKTLRECMQGIEDVNQLQFYRLPITAEQPPNFHDLAELVEIVRKAHKRTSPAQIVVNCQLGQGRSTQTTVIILMTQHWLSSNSSHPFLMPAGQEQTHSFQITNNLLRVVKNSREIQATVHHFIRQCGEQMDLLENILSCRQMAIAASGDRKEDAIAKGLLGLKRFWRLILLAIYFAEESPSSKTSFEHFVASRPVFATLQAEFDNAGLHTLKPLGEEQQNANDVDKLQKFISKRNGRVLSSATILKSDFFSGLQKKLPESVPGSPNFRRIPIATRANFADVEIYGTGMPTADGLHAALHAMQADPSGNRKVFFQSLREEPVLYVASRPHVLRLSDAPFDNIVTTGVTTARVVGIEEALKQDARHELHNADGTILLHDEALNADGQFSLKAEWAAVKDEQIKTTADVFADAKDAGFQVDFMRLPVTDEQSPLPQVVEAVEERVVRALSVRKAQDPLGFAFNCQMGRGRTTTAMVIGSLTVVILFGGSLTPFSQPSSPVDPNKRSQIWDESSENIYLRGEYRSILQLLAVLQNGRAAKETTDLAVDAMAAIQNLREAIYSYKLRSEAAEANSAQQNKILSVGLNYLYRYGLLISFTQYVLSRRAEMGTDVSAHVGSSYKSSFGQWLSEHKEVSRILTKRTME